MSVLMPRGVTRGCSEGCGFTTYTHHTEQIPCSREGCTGHLMWPSIWPHVCPNGHSAEVEVDVAATPKVPVTPCQGCTDARTARDRRTG